MARNDSEDAIEKRPRNVVPDFSRCKIPARIFGSFYPRIIGYSDFHVDFGILRPGGDRDLMHPRHDCVNEKSAQSAVRYPPPLRRALHGPSKGGKTPDRQHDAGFAAGIDDRSIEDL